MGDAERPPGDDTDVLEKPEEKVKEPELYKVVLMNDDYTPREFVVEILVKVFRKSGTDAHKIMMRAHRSGRADVGVYTYDIATTKVSQARNKAKENGYPLKFVVEPA